MAKERIENRKLTGKFKVNCKFEDGTSRIWEGQKEDVVAGIVSIVNDFARQGYVLTLRQLHYQFVKNNWIVNHDSAYKKLGDILNDCKYSGVVDWSHIEDRGRKPYLQYYVNDVEDALNDTIKQYKLDRQKGQKRHIELWTEKDAISAILRRSTEKYHIQLVVNKGYTSSSAIYQAYQRIVKAIDRNKKVTILYFGDHDPSGKDMVRDIATRIVTMLVCGKNYQRLFGEPIDPSFGKKREVLDFVEIVPIGLTMEQIEEFDLPPNPTKLTDSRARKYIAEFGRQCWEVDALNPSTLTSIVEENIESRMDMKLFNEMLKKEEDEKNELREFIESRN